MMTPKNDPQYTVTVRALPREVPAPVRLRLWLKQGLRSFGLRCEQIAPAAEQEEAKEEAP